MDSATNYEEMDALAAQSPAGSRGLIFQPYLLGARSPHWKPNVRGAFLGIDISHGIHDFLRAIMEGVAYSMQERLLILEDEFGMPIKEVTTIGGGAKSELWCQIMADVANRPMKRIQGAEMECLGSAILASVPIVHDSIEIAINEMVHDQDTFTPGLDNHQLYSEMYQRYCEFFRNYEHMF